MCAFMAKVANNVKWSKHLYASTKVVKCVRIIIVCFWTELNKLAKRLSKRIPKHKRAKEKKLSEIPSSLMPPVNAPKWAVSQQWTEHHEHCRSTEEMYVYIYIQVYGILYT